MTSTSTNNSNNGCTKWGFKPSENIIFRPTGADARESRSSPRHKDSFFIVYGLHRIFGNKEWLRAFSVTLSNAIEDSTVTYTEIYWRTFQRIDWHGSAEEFALLAQLANLWDCGRLPAAELTDSLVNAADKYECLWFLRMLQLLDRADEMKAGVEAVINRAYAIGFYLPWRPYWLFQYLCGYEHHTYELGYIQSILSGRNRLEYIKKRLVSYQERLDFLVEYSSKTSYTGPGDAAPAEDDLLFPDLDLGQAVFDPSKDKRLLARADRRAREARRDIDRARAAIAKLEKHIKATDHDDRSQYLKPITNTEAWAPEHRSCCDASFETVKSAIIGGYDEQLYNKLTGHFTDCIDTCARTLAMKRPGFISELYGYGERGVADCILGCDLNSLIQDMVQKKRRA